MSPMKVKGNSAKRLKYKHATVRLPQDFMWKLLSKVHADTVHLAKSLGIEDDANIFYGIIRRRDVAGYISACDDRWSLTNLSRSVDETDDQLTLQRIRVLRLYTIAKKYVFEESPFDTIATALKKFIEYEQKCSITNNDPIFYESLCDAENKDMSHYDSLFIWPVLQKARQFISNVLGESPDVTELMLRSHHGPGASIGRRGKKSLPVAKYFPPYTSTELSTNLVKEFLTGDERLKRSLYDADLAYSEDIITEAAILFVPKNAKTARTIMVEATGNVALQLGVDRLIRERLLRFGIDLSTQRKNQQLAALYSQNNDGCTVDLSGASDTIALNWLLLFPPKWAELLFHLRTPNGATKDGKHFLFEKLSSMGNGYTFVIETLIFSSLLYGVIREEGGKWKDEIAFSAIYGDDLVFRKKYYRRYAAILKRMGFKINGSKSFHAGFIRESCGCDFYKGKDISVFNTQRVTDHCDLNTLHNSLFSVENRFGIMLTLSRLFVMESIPHLNRSYGLPSEDVNAYLFTNSLSALDTFYSKRYQCLMYRVGFLRKIRPDLYQPLSRLLGPKIVHFLPLVDYLNSFSESWTDQEIRNSWFEKSKSRLKFRGPEAHESPIKGKMTSSRERELFLSALFDKNVYAIRSAVVSRPLIG